MAPVSRLRSALSRRVDAAISWRVEVALGERVAELERRAERQRGRLDAVEREAEWATNQLARLAPQVASLEHRLERVAAGAQAVPAGAAAQDVAREHEQVRARLALVSAYEERLRRLERTPLGAGALEGSGA